MNKQTRKPYEFLSKKKQKRRQEEIISQTSSNVKKAVLDEGNTSFEVTNNVCDSEIVIQSSLDLGLHSTQNIIVSSDDETSSDDQLLDINEDCHDAGSLQFSLNKDFTDSFDNNYIPMPDESKIETALRNWTIDCPNVPNSSVSNLLHHLNHFYPGIVLTARTQKDETAMDITITNMLHGRYAHINNWQISLHNYLQSINFEDVYLKLNVNIDGIPLFEDSRKFHAYPILMELCINTPKIICIGIYLSESGESNKMPHVNMFLEKFVSEMKYLTQNGIKINGKDIPILINAFVCDAPARSDLKLIVNHNSYNS